MDPRGLGRKILWLIGVALLEDGATAGPGDVQVARLIRFLCRVAKDAREIACIFFGRSDRQ